MFLKIILIIAQLVAQAMKEYGAVVRIPIGDIAGRAVSGVTDIGLFDNVYQNNQKYVTYWEAVFKHDDGTGNVAYFIATANAGDSYLTVGVNPDPNPNYEVLVLAGTPANNNVSTGQKVLLGSGYQNKIAITQNKVNEVKVKMYGVGVKMGVKGVAKGALNKNNPSGEPAENLVINKDTKEMRYVQLERANSKSGIYADALNPWWDSGTVFKDLEIQIELEQLTPLLRAFNAPIGADDIAGEPVPPAAGNRLFVAESVEIRTMSYRKYPMELVSFDPGIATVGTSHIGVDVDENGFTGHTAITLDYTLPSYVPAAATPPAAAKVNIPDADAAGIFHFNFEYNPFSLKSPPEGEGLRSSAWNVRNRILWDGEGYYGGGVAFLFGNGATAEVIVETSW
jgi:hypothetical protein